MPKRKRKAGPPALVPRLVAIATLTEDAHNARTHSERNIDAIVKSLKAFGQQKPIVITPDNVVRAGNGTLRAAKRLGWTEINCVVTNLKTAEELRAYAIADNRVGELSDFDESILAEQLGLMEKPLLEVVGFDDAELEEISRALNPDQAAAPAQKRGLTGAKSPSVRVMVAIAQVADFERAMRATGLTNRGEALMVLVRHYLDTIAPDDDDRTEAGQLDADIEAQITAGSAAELAA